MEDTVTAATEVSQAKEREERAEKPTTLAPPAKKTAIIRGLIRIRRDESGK
jgi:hypothetical protein